MRHPTCPARLTLLGAAAVLACGPAAAIEFDTGHEDFKLRLDTTAKYSAAARLKDRSPGLSTTSFGAGGAVIGPNNVNQDDGNNNFGQGLVSNRLDLLGELDASYRDFALRVSAAAWYDTVYQRGTDNTTTTSNHVPAREFAAGTREVMGGDAEVLDAFVSGRFTLGGMPLTLRLGRHTLLWGEALFFGANGIAGGQAPTDLVKVLSVPNATFKETVRPTGKLSAQWQLNADVAFGAYVGYEWEATRLMPVGAYLSTSDVLGPGAERLRLGPTTLNRVPDIEPRDRGQGGVQLRLRADAIDTDFGFYAIRFHASSPSNIYTTPALGSTRFAYHEGVRAIGASAAKAFGPVALAAEASVRSNAPLASAGRTITGSTIGFDNRDNPGYAVGRTAHVQLNWLASFGPNAIANESSFLGEVAWNRRLSITKNEAMLNPLADASATSIRLVYSATYRQVMDGLDLTPSVGASHTRGRSSAIGPGFGVHKGGDYSLGLSATYLDRWTMAASFVGYYGPEGGSLNNQGLAQYKQALRDRHFMTLSLRTTF